MRATCPSCQTNYNIDDKRIPPGGAKLKCAKCQTSFPIKPAGPSEPAPPPPAPGVLVGGAAAAPVPLPGTAPKGTVMFAAAPPLVPPAPPPSAVPLPGSAPKGTVMFAAAPAPLVPPPPGAVPLPGSAPKGTVMFAAAPAAPPRVPPAPPPGAVPLPGSAPKGTVMFAAAPAAPPLVPPVSAVPLPGTETPPPDDAFPEATSPEPQSWETDATRIGSLNADSSLADELGFSEPPAPPPPLPEEAPDAAQTWESETTRVATEGEFAQPPPASPESGDDLGFSVTESEPPPPVPAVAPPELPPTGDTWETEATRVGTPEEIRSAGAGTPSSPTVLDFGDLPSPGAGGDATASPTPLDFGGLDSPPPASAPLDFGDFPVEPPPPPPSSREAEAAPPPPPPPPAPAINPSLSFGDVDFGDAPAPAEAAPPAAAPAGVEMLDFLAGGVPKEKPPSGASRFHIRRKSGKVFGPFEEEVVRKMLEDGQLVGNEDISTDGENWTALSANELFRSVAPASPAPAPADNASEEPGSEAPSPAAPPASDPGMERLKQLYGGRMAGVTVVNRQEPFTKVRSLIPIAIATVAVLLVVGAGASLALTRYGAFGLRYLFPATLSPKSAEATELEKARGALLGDTYKGYVDAKETTDRILKTKEFPEVRAVWCQAVFYLQRRYAAGERELPSAKSSLEGIKLLGEKHREVVKALAGGDLVDGRPELALERLKGAVGRAGNEDDIELNFLLAEAYVARKDPKSARERLERVLTKHKDSAKALHALGNILQQAGEGEKAVAAYTQALEADPYHVISAIELAAVELLLNKEIEKGIEALARPLDDATRPILGPAELARARALYGFALASQFKPKEAAAEFEQALKLDPGSSFAKGHLARLYLLQKNFEAALPLYKEAAAREPQNLEVTEGYIRSLVNAGKMIDAKEAAAAANNRFPGNARIAYLFAQIDDALDNAKEAEAHLKRAVAADPKLFEANLYLARFYIKFKRYPEAKAQVEAAFSAAPESAAVRAAVGELAFSEGDLERAKTEFEKAQSMDPSLPEAFVGLARVAVEEDRFEKGKELAEKALDLEPKVKDGLLAKGLALWKLGQLDDAIAALEEAKKLDPKGARVAVVLGAVRLEKGDLPGAEGNLSAALQREPSNHEAHFYMARVKARAGHYTGAIESMKAALEQAPKRPTYHYELGLIYRDAKRLTDAMDAWNKAIELEPKYADALEALGHAQLDRAENAKAVSVFETALAADPSRTRILALIGDCFYADQKWDKAIARYQEALRIDPSAGALYYKIGRSHTEKQEHMKAVTWYKKATELDPMNPMPYYYLGFAYKDRGQKREAAKAFKAYLERKPEAEDRREIEDELFYLK